MNEHYEDVRAFLQNPEDVDSLFESEALIWVDWREDDEDLIRYFNDELEEQFEVQLVDNNKPYGDDIVLKQGEKQLTIPYKEVLDRDTTIKYLNEFIKPKYEIRWAMESLGNDTLAFVLLEANQWKSLEDEFGKDNLCFHFATIDLEKSMFDLSFDEVSKLLDIRDSKK